jgi:hypothetical protein
MEMATGARARLTAGACRWPVNALGPVRGAAARRLGYERRRAADRGWRHCGDCADRRHGAAAAAAVQPDRAGVLWPTCATPDSPGRRFRSASTSRGARCCRSSPVRCRTARRRVSVAPGQPRFPLTYLCVFALHTRLPAISALPRVAAGGDASRKPPAPCTRFGASGTAQGHGKVVNSGAVTSPMRAVRSVRRCTR